MDARFEIEKDEMLGTWGNRNKVNCCRCNQESRDLRVMTKVFSDGGVGMSVPLEIFRISKIEYP
jgi:hypothetical protein